MSRSCYGGFLNLSPIRDILALQLLPNGVLDGTFGNGGITVLSIDLGGLNDDLGNVISIGDDGNIFIAGTSTREILTTLTSTLNTVVIRLLGEGPNVPNVPADSTRAAQVTACTRLYRLCHQ